MGNATLRDTTTAEADLLLALALDGCHPVEIGLVVKTFDTAPVDEARLQEALQTIAIRYPSCRHLVNWRP